MVILSMIEPYVAYLLGALADGGCYKLSYKRKRSEYRCVWTQRELEWLEKSVVPRLVKLREKLGIEPKIKVYKGRTRYEARISSKALYEYMKNASKELDEALKRCSTRVITYWIRGLYDAEGDKSCKRIRIWSSNKTLLEKVRMGLRCIGIDSNGPYVDDKRHSVYVLEIPSKHRRKFLIIIRPEHPRIIMLT